MLKHTDFLKISFRIDAGRELLYWKVKNIEIHAGYPDCRWQITVIRVKSGISEISF